MMMIGGKSDDPMDRSGIFFYKAGIISISLYDINIIMRITYDYYPVYVDLSTK